MRALRERIFVSPVPLSHVVYPLSFAMAQPNPMIISPPMEAMGHGKAFIQTTIGGTLSPLVGDGGARRRHHHPRCLRREVQGGGDKCKDDTKDKFGVARVNNLTTGNNNPLWWLGSDDAGWGGSVMRETTRTMSPSTHPDGVGGRRLRTRPDLGTQPSCNGWDPRPRPRRPPSAQSARTRIATSREAPQGRRRRRILRDPESLSDDQLNQLMHQGDTLDPRD